MEKKDFDPTLAVTRINDEVCGLYCRLHYGLISEHTFSYDMLGGGKINIDVANGKIIGIEITGLENG